MSSKNESDATSVHALWTWLTPKSLAARLTAWYALCTFIVVLAVLSVLYTALIKVFNAETDEFLRDNLSYLVQSLREEGDASLRREGLAVRQFSHVFIRVFNGKGDMLRETPGMSKDLQSAIFTAPENDPNTLSGNDYITPKGRRYRTMSLKIANSPDPENIRVVQIACDRKRESGMLRRYRRSLWTIAIISVMACALIGYLIAHRGMRRVNQIILAARHVRSTTLHERIDIANLPAELRALAETFNEMLDRLEESFTRLSRFSADIAHEIRTPVNNLRGEVEVALGKARTPDEYRDVLGSTLEECERLSQIVDRMLFIAKAENSQLKPQLEAIDIDAELASVLEFYEAPAADAGVELSIGSHSKLQMQVDRVLFQRAVGNLVSNAIAHTPRGGRVSVDSRATDSDIEISVSDTGCGIPAEHIPHLFNRFYRVDNARSKNSGGVGLGLAIVKTIANLHNAAVNISSVPGSGTRISMKFKRTATTQNSSSRHQNVIAAEQKQFPSLGLPETNMQS